MAFFDETIIVFGFINLIQSIENLFQCNGLSLILFMKTINFFINLVFYLFTFWNFYLLAFFHAVKFLAK